MRLDTRDTSIWDQKPADFTPVWYLTVEKSTTSAQSCKVGDCSGGWTKVSLFDSWLHQGVRKSATPFPGMLHFTHDPYFTLLIVKQGGIKYHFLCLWYDSNWDWTIMPIRICIVFFGLYMPWTATGELNLWKELCIILVSNTVLFYYFYAASYKKLLHGHITLISKTNKLWRARHAGHFWRSKYEVINSYTRIHQCWPTRKI